MKKKRKSIILTDEQITRILNASKNQIVNNEKTCDNIENRRVKNVDEFMEKISSSNPHRVLEFFYPVDEGLIKSYDTDQVINIMQRKFKLDSEAIYSCDYELDGEITKLIFVKLPKNSNKKIKGDLEHYLGVCGYFLARKCETDDGRDVFIYEANFGKDVTDLVKNNYDCLFHSTPIIYLSKILKIGLVPRAKSSIFLYPDRVYCMKGNHLRDNQIITLKDIQTTRSVDDPNVDNRHVILIIDIKKIPNNVKFFIDPKCDDAIYTHDNIPPDAISIYGFLNEDS